MRRARARRSLGGLAAQEGVVVPVAAAVLLVMSLLGVALWSLALQTNASALKDRNAKRALAAAEAGLQTAVYRLNQIRNPAVPAGSCLTTAAVAPVAGECPGLTEGLGNGAHYTYHVTPQLGPTGACVSLPGVPAAATDRCITSTGTVHGVSRRIQARFASQPAFASFGSVGLIGKSLVYGWNSVNFASDIGSDLRVELVNSVNVQENEAIDVNGSVKLLTGGTYWYQNSVNVDGGTQTVTTPFDLPQADFETPENANNNSVLEPTVFDQTTRRFNLASGEYTIPPGTYHLCDLFLGNSVKFRLLNTPSQPTRIYIDSPARAGSPCTGSDGRFAADNSVEINKEVGERAELLEVYLYGTGQEDSRTPYSWCSLHTSPALPDECKSDFMLDNSVQFYGTVHAPASTVQAHNSVNIYGGIAADKVRLYNSVNFALPAAVKNKPATSGGAVTRKAWTECRRQPPAPTDPESGC